MREKLRVEQGVKVGFVYGMSELCAIFYTFLSLLLHDYFSDLNIYTVQYYSETEDKEIQLRALGKLLILKESINLDSLTYKSEKSCSSLVIDSE